MLILSNGSILNTGNSTKTSVIRDDSGRVVSLTMKFVDGSQHRVEDEDAEQLFRALLEHVVTPAGQLSPFGTFRKASDQ